MTQESEPTATSDQPPCLNQAIEIMTRLFRETDDYSEAVTIVLASVAANAGSSYALISGRPGSWESSVLSQMLGSTVSPDDAVLMQYRTEPVTVRLNIEDALTDLGILEPWDYEDRLMRRLDDQGTSAKHPDGGTVFTPNDPDDYETQLVENSHLAEAYTQKYQAAADIYFTHFETNLRIAAAAEQGGLPAHITVGAQRVTDEPDDGHRIKPLPYLTLEERLYMAAFEATAAPENLENTTFS